jgi:hypothetical protein
MPPRNKSRRTKRKVRVHGEVRVLGEVLKSRFSRMILIAPVSNSPRACKIIFRKCDFPERFCIFLILRKKVVKLEVKIWTFGARFPRENRHFVPLNFLQLTLWPNRAIFESSFRSAQYAPNVFAN